MRLPKDPEVALSNALDAARQHLEAACHWRGVAEALIAERARMAEERARIMGVLTERQLAKLIQAEQAERGEEG